jgi:hypothetical protein
MERRQNKRGRPEKKAFLEAALFNLEWGICCAFSCCEAARSGHGSGCGGCMRTKPREGWGGGAGRNGHSRAAGLKHTVALRRGATNKKSLWGFLETFC